MMTSFVNDIGSAPTPIFPLFPVVIKLIFLVEMQRKPLCSIGHASPLKGAVGRDAKGSCHKASISNWPTRWPARRGLVPISWRWGRTWPGYPASNTGSLITGTLLSDALKRMCPTAFQHGLMASLLLGYGCLRTKLRTWNAENSNCWWQILWLKLC